MIESGHGTISVERGLEGDFRGSKYPQRQITVLAREDWYAALADLDTAGRPPLPWTARRANLLVEGVVLPRSKGSILAVGPVVLEVTGVTSPCARMEEAAPGLLKALGRDGRGGVTTRVLEAGDIRIGDPVVVRLELPERRIRLPG